MSVYSFLTNQGQAALNTALTGGTNVVLTKFKVGTSTAPHSAADTDLFSPVYTGTFTGKVIKPIDMYLSIVDCIVPYTSGGYTITEVGLYFTQKIAGVPTDILFAVVQYPPTPKNVGSNYPITLIIQTGTNSGDSVAITVPNNQFATINYVDIAKHAGLADMLRPMTNDNVYITPKWLETFLASNANFSGTTAANATWASDLSGAVSPSLIYVEDASTQTLNGESRKFSMADWLIKFQDPNTGIYEYTPVKRSYTQYVSANATPFTIPVENLASGIICTVTNTTGVTSTINLPAALNFVNGTSTITLRPDESATITRINNTAIVALIGIFNLPAVVSITGYYNQLDATMANIDASISFALFTTLLTNAPSGCVMVVDVPGYQTINTEDYYLNFGDVVIKDPAGNVTVQKQYFNYYTQANAAFYNMDAYELSDGTICSIENTTASTTSLINLPIGYTFTDGVTSSFDLRPSSTLTLFKDPGTTTVIKIGEMCAPISTGRPAGQGNLYSMYNVAINASMAPGAFALTLNTMPQSTLMRISVAGTQIVSGISYQLEIDDLILKDNLGVYKVIQTALKWKYLPITVDTILTAVQLPLKTHLTVENTSSFRLKVTLPAGYTFTRNNKYYPNNIEFILNATENVTLTLADQALNTIAVVANEGTEYPLSARIASTAGGGIDNGIIIYSSNRIPGRGQILISQTPATNYVTVETNIGKDFQGYGLLGTAAVSTGGGYPDNGILLYDKTSGAGTSALLIGDAGLCYDVTYLGAITSNPSVIHASEVTAGFDSTPTGGLLICSSTATVGYGAILLGNDGLAYRITL